MNNQSEFFAGNSMALMLFFERVGIVSVNVFPEGIDQLGDEGARSRLLTLSQSEERG